MGTQRDDRPIEPMYPNPGGIVDPEHLIDRDGELTVLLAAVEGQGAYVVGDRRMGKTSLLRKAELRLREAGHTVVRATAESSSLEQFSETLLAAIRREARLAERLRQWEKEIDGSAQLKVLGSGLKVSGKLTRTAAPVEDDLIGLCSRAIDRTGPYRLVLIVDEVAVLANHLHEEGGRAASDFLHSLRATRQSLDNVAVVLAGSVGLHHAVDDLTSLNDLRDVPVGPLEARDAVHLARCLVLGVFRRDDADTVALAEIVAGECSGIPYYIHSLLGAYQANETPLPTGEEIADRLDEALAAGDWGIDHYYDRIATYYSTDAPLVIQLLDEIAANDRARSLDQLVAALQRTKLGEPGDRAKIGGLLRKMARDHYVDASAEGYAMSSAFLRRVWLALRKQR